MLLETDLKSLTLNELKNRGVINSNSLIINELTLGNFARRVDLVVSSDDKLIAIEIKSQADSLTRLEGQVKKYLEYFDKVIVVADSKFISKLQSELSKNIGIWEVRKKQIKVIKRGIIQKKIEKQKLIELMDVTDLSKLSTKLKLKCKKDRSSLQQALLDAPNKELKKGVLESLRRKFGATTTLFHESTQDRTIENSHIDELSRFRGLREKETNEKLLNESFWNNFDNYLNKLNEFAKSFVATSNQSNHRQCRYHQQLNHNEAEYEDVY